VSEVADRFWIDRVRAPSPYPERAEQNSGQFDLFLLGITARFRQALRGDLRRARRFVKRVDAHQAWADGLSEAGLLKASVSMRGALLRNGFTPSLTARCFALVRAAAAQTLGIRHFPVQLMGGWVLLNGRVAEMATGEGKTLTATLAAATVALAGQPVHVVTVNEYLARRDAEWMEPVYRALGLSVGVAESGQEPAARRAAYGSDVCYCTNHDVGFDYLRDTLVLGRRRGRARLLFDSLLQRSDQLSRLLHRGLHYAIVDEIDSVLVDEARTPLIIAGNDRREAEVELYESAMRLTSEFTPGEDFKVDAGERSLWFTDQGLDKLEGLAGHLPRAWRSKRAREELLRQALSAVHLYEKDKQYLVRDDKVHIIDEFTGRVMADRSWERGLHQLIEVKEGCALTSGRETLARITYQRLFRRYLRVAGMSGTVAEISRELETVYDLKTVRVPRNRRDLGKDLGARMYVTARAKWEAVADSVMKRSEQGRPVLIGTRSLADSEQLSTLFFARGIDHVVLNARQDASEAAIVADAGQASRITIATNMAGRGTDIHLSDEAREHGGLHVILTEFHESPRIDRQLYGRCARQGDPGSYEAIVSIEDEIFLQNTSGAASRLGRKYQNRSRPLPRWRTRWLRAIAQRAAERKSAQARRATMEQDRKRDASLGFAGSNE